MVETEQTNEKQTQSWSQKQVYVMSVICLVVGLTFGYFLRGSDSKNAKVAVVSTEPSAPAMPPAAGTPQQQQMPSLDDMKRMADKQAEPLLAKLKNDPKNAKLLVQIGNAYKSAHQFGQAANYFGQALELDPKNITLRDEVGAALYYSGDVDRAMATFEEGLKYAPNEASMLFDLGVMKLEKKGDPQGAIALWQRLLKGNPDLSPEKKQQIEKMIAEAKTRKRPEVN
jgi:cytochrome c-type biogenesis protein CcmH/NrfG